MNRGFFQFTEMSNWCFLLQTYIGDILLAVNPYKSLNLYNAEVRCVISWLLIYGKFCILYFLYSHFCLQPAYFYEENILELI